MRSPLTRLLVFVVVCSQAVFAQSPAHSRIERGLLPPAPNKGEAGWTIQERMKHYRIPCVRIAVINDYKVEWARGYSSLRLS